MNYTESDYRRHYGLFGSEMEAVEWADKFEEGRRRAFDFEQGKWYNVDQHEQVHN